jgi:hypothetical protein
MYTYITPVHHKYSAGTCMNVVCAMLPYALRNIFYVINVWILNV